jgi:DNA-binding transcriptional LysR family regulator
MIFHEFDKLRTFLLVMKEKSLSSASKKLEVSQPAVTQQIQYIENLTGFKIIERKRQGVELTKKGEYFFEISKRLEKALSIAYEDLAKLRGKNLSFLVGATFLVGDHIFSKIATEFRKNIKINFSLEIDNPNEILTLLKNKKLDIVLTEGMIADDEIQYFEWLDDELLIFSNQKIPKTLDASLLNIYQWVCRDKKSNTRKLFKESLELASMPDCDDFMMITDTTSSTSILQTVLHSRNNEGFPPVASVISKFAIFDYVKDQKLFVARLPKVKMKRKIYIACLKENLDEEIIQNAIQFLKSKSDDFYFKI